MKRVIDNKLAIAAFAEANDIDLVILFGSQAKGTATFESDTDIAVRSKKTLTLEEKLSLAAELEGTFSNVEIVDIRAASPLLLAAVAKDGKPLFESRPGLFQEFKLLAFNMYWDFKPVLDRLKQKNKVAIEGFMK